MDEAGIKLRCLELAIDQVRREGSINFRESVADLQTWFYNRIANEVKPVQGQGQKAPLKR